MSGNKVHKGQTQTFEGNQLGEPISNTKLAYDAAFNVEYIGECKVGVKDEERRHYIEKFEYDSSFNLSIIKVAQNTLIGNSTNISINTSFNSSHIRIILNNGDCSEINIGDNFSVVTNNQAIRGNIVKVISNTEFWLLKSDNTSAIEELDVTILPESILYHLQHDNTKDYTKRRWDIRTRYIYL
jgi:hypothetical protein